MQIEVTSDYRLEDHFPLDTNHERIIKDADLTLKADFNIDCGDDVHFINCEFSGPYVIDLGRQCAHIKFSSCKLRRNTPIVNGDQICIENCTGCIEIIGGVYVSVHDAGQMEYVRSNNAYSLNIYGTLPDVLDIYRCKRININNANNDNDHCSINIQRLAGRYVHIINSKLPNTKLSIMRSNMGCMKICDTELSKLVLDRSVIECLEVDESQIEQVMSHDSVCHLYAPTNSIKLKLASPPSTFNNSQFTLYKKVFIKPLFGKLDEAILELTVPQNAYVFPPYMGQSKMRVSKAIPVALYDLEGNRITRLPFWKRIISQYDFKYRYKIWKLATPKEPFDMSTRVCGSGIHGFLTFDEARNY